jgi:hypothetical protein
VRADPGRRGLRGQCSIIIQPDDPARIGAVEAGRSRWEARATTGILGWSVPRPRERIFGNLERFRCSPGKRLTRSRFSQDPPGFGLVASPSASVPSRTRSLLMGVTSTSPPNPAASAEIHRIPHRASQSRLGDAHHLSAPLQIRDARMVMIHRTGYLRNQQP